MSAARKADRSRLLRTAERYVAKNAYKKAAAIYREVLKGDAGDLHSRHKLAEVLVRSGAIETARDEYLDVAERYRHRGFDLKAIGALKVLLAHDPVDLLVNERLVDAFSHLGLNGDAVSRLHVLAQEYEDQGDLEKAVQKREQIKKLAPQDILNSLQLGESLRARGASGKSTEVFKEVLTSVGKKTTSALPFVKVAQRLLEMGHEDVSISRQVARSLLEHGDLRSALEWLERCQKLAPNDVETLETFAELFERAGHTEKHTEVKREIARLTKGSGSRPPFTKERESELAVRVVDDATPPNGTPPPVTPPPKTRKPAPAPKGLQSTKPPPIPADALSSSSPKRALSSAPPIKLRTAPPPHRSPRPPPLPPRALEAIVEKELDDAFSVAFRPAPSTPQPIVAPQPSPGEGSRERVGNRQTGDKRTAVLPPPALFSPTPLPTPLEDTKGDFEVHVFDSVVQLPSNLLPAEERCRDSRVAPPADGNQMTSEDVEVEIDVGSLATPVAPKIRPDVASVRLDPEVDRLLSGVRTLLEFDIVDKALRVATKALELAPDDPQVRELHKLTLYRAGKAGGRETSVSALNRDGDENG